MKRRLMALLMALVMALSLVPTVAFATDPVTLYVDAVSGNDETGEGTQASPYKTLGKAIGAVADGGTIEIGAGNFDASSTGLLDGLKDKTVTFVGQSQDATILDWGSGQKTATNAKLTFKNMTLGVTHSGMSYTQAIQHVNTEIYENVTFNFAMSTQHTALFRNCTFNHSTDDEYLLWVYCGEATAENCKFYGAKKAHVKVYGEKGNDAAVILDKCEFITPEQLPTGWKGCDVYVSNTNNGSNDVVYSVTVKDCISSYSNYYGSDAIVKDSGKASDVKAFKDGKQVYPAVPTPTADLTISTAAELVAFAQAVNGGNKFVNKLVVLDADIDLKDVAWVPIGNVKDYPGITFNGIFDGQNHTISNMNAEDNSTPHWACAGLFGSVEGEIKNVIVDHATVSSTHYAGGIVGYSSSGSTKIINCKVTNSTITSVVEKIDSGYDNGDKSGGIAGYIANSAEVTGCEVSGCTVKGYRDIGGAVGYVNDGCKVSGVTVKDTQVICDKSQNYKNYTEDAQYDVHEVVGESSGTVENNTVTNVTVSFIGTPEVIVDGNKTATVTTEQDSKVVVDTEAASEVKEFAKQLTETNTKVTGVALTTKVEEGDTEAKSGLQQIVDEAKKTAGTTEAAALKAATEVKVEVNVEVEPVAYSNKTDNGTVKFSLTPKATVKAITESKPEGVVVAKDLKVTNDMIDTTKPITVSFYTDFEPAQVIHTGEQNFVESFNQGEFDYEGGICTVTISHFSDLTAVEQGKVARIGAESDTLDNYYSTMADAAAAWAANGGTLTLLSNVEYGMRINLQDKNDFVLDLNGFTYNAGSGNSPLDVYSSLVIKDSSEAQTGTIVCDFDSNAWVFVVYVENNATLTVESGTIIGKNGASDNKSGCIYGTNSAAINVSGGEIIDQTTGANGNRWAVEMNGSGTISGGTLTGDVWLASGGVVTDGKFGGKVYSDGASVQGGVYANGSFAKGAPANGFMLTANTGDDKEAYPYKVVSYALSGTGTQTDPFVINNLEDLKFFRDQINAKNNYNNKYVRLDADIDLGNNEWVPIGHSSEAVDQYTFCGIFDGNHHKISNLKVSSGSCIGLFGYVGSSDKANATIKDLTIENVDLYGTSNVAALSGFAKGGVNSNYFQNINVTGSVKIHATNDAAGGVIGHLEGIAEFTNCSVDADAGSYIKTNATSSGAAGGIVGFVTNYGTTIIDDCHVKNVALTAYNRVGGIGGQIQMTTSQAVKFDIKDCSVENVTVTVKGDPISTSSLNSSMSAQAGLIAGTVADNGHRNLFKFSNNTYTGDCKVISTANDPYVIETALYGLWTLGAQRVKDYGQTGSSWYTTNGNADITYASSEETGEVLFGGTYYKTFLSAYHAEGAGKTGSAEVKPFKLMTDVGYSLVVGDKIYVEGDGHVFYPRTDVDGYHIKTTVINDNVTLYELEPDPGAKFVASLTVGDGEAQNYVSIAAAVSAAPKNGTPCTITVLDNCSISNEITVPTGADVTLELKGKTVEMVDVASKYMFIVKGGLTVQDNTDANKDGTGNGKLYIHSNTKSIYGLLKAQDGGKIIINSGLLLAESASTNNIYGLVIGNDNSNNSITANGGKVKIDLGTNTGKYSYAFWGNSGAKGSFTLNGAILEGNSTAQYIIADNSSYGAITLSLIQGKIISHGSSSSKPIDNYADWNSAGNYVGTPLTNILAEGSAINKPDDHTRVIFKAVAQIGDVKYATLQAAVDAAEIGDTVTLLTDIDSDETISMSGKNITVDLNGKKISCTGGHNGTISACGNNREILTIKNGTVEILRGKGTVQGGAIYGGGNNNTINLVDMTIVVGEYEVAGALAMAGSTITLTNTTVEASGEISEALCAAYGGKIIFNSGKLIASGKNSILVDSAFSGSEITIKGGELSYKDDVVNAGNLIVEYSKGVVSLEGGYYTWQVNDEYVADGYQCISTPETDANHDTYPYMIGVIPVVEVQEVTVDQEGNVTKGGETFTVTTNGEPTQKETGEAVERTLDNEAVSGMTAAQTNIEKSTDVAAQTKVSADGFNISMILNAIKTAANKQWEDANAKASKNDQITITGDAVQEFEDEDVTKFITIDLTAAEVTKGKFKVELQGGTQETTETVVTRMTYDVTPKATVTVVKGGQTTTVTAVIPNEAITAPITFRLPVDSAVPAGTLAKVWHKTTLLEKNYAVQKDLATDEKYIELESMEFSDFTYELDMDETVREGAAYVYGKTLLLESNVFVRYYIEADAEKAADYQVKYTFDHLEDFKDKVPDVKKSFVTLPVENGQTVAAANGFTITECSNNSNVTEQIGYTKKTGVNLYYFDIPVYVKEFADVITVTIHDNTKGESTATDIVSTYSVRQYCKNMIDKNDDAKLVTLCRIMLDYGSYMQEYKGYYKTNPQQGEVKFANDDFARVTLNSIPEGNYTNLVTNVPDPNIVVGASLMLEDVTRVRFYFRNGVLDYSESISDGKLKQLGSTDYYYIEAEASLPAWHLNGATSATVGPMELQYSPLAYAYSMQNDATVGNLCKAMYQYYQAAAAYFNK